MDGAIVGGDGAVGEDAADTLGDQYGAVEGGFRKQDGDLLAADAARDIHGTQDLGESFGERI